MFKLQRLKVHQCRSVLPGTELEFNGGFNIPLGKNGAGKTTLLKLVAAAIGSSFADEFQFDDLHVEYEYTLDDIRVVCEVQYGAGIDDGSIFGAVAPHVRDFTLKAEFVGPNSGSVSVEIQSNRLTVISQGTQRFSNDVNPIITGVPSLDLVAFIAAELARDFLPPEIQSSLGTSARVTHRLDEGMDWLRDTLRNFSITFSVTDHMEDWCLPNLACWGAADGFRAGLAEYRHRFADLPEVIALHAGDLPFLQCICQQIGLRDVSWTLSFLAQDHRSKTKRYGNSQVYVTTMGGTRLPLEKLSFGQLRLFGFFLHSMMHPHAVVIDELTNGLHHEMIDCCLETIGGRQAFLATQNPLLIDYVGFASAEEARRTFILCELQTGADGEKAMLWRNMSDEEAREFYGDYEVGVQHANDILRKRGLW